MPSLPSIMASLALSRHPRIEEGTVKASGSRAQQKFWGGQTWVPGPTLSPINRDTSGRPRRACRCIHCQLYFAAQCRSLCLHPRFTLPLLRPQPPSYQPYFRSGLNLSELVTRPIHPLRHSWLHSPLPPHLTDRRLAKAVPVKTLLTFLSWRW